MELSYFNFISISIIGAGLIVSVRMVHQFRSKKCKCIAKVKKTVVITGATSGLGEACASELARRNCRLILGCRNIQLGEKVVEAIRKSNETSDVKMIHLDLTDLDSIKQFADSLHNERVDVLINNAGVMAGHFRMVKSTKTEEDMTVNYLGHFYLTNLLLKNLQLKKSLNRNDNGDSIDDDEASRVILISSSLSKYGRLAINSLDLSKDPYSPKQAYANSKLALNIFAQEFHRRFNNNLSSSSVDGGRTVNVLTMFTGGMVDTRLSRHIIATYSVFLQPLLRIFLRIFLRNAQQACHPIVHCVLSEELKSSSGELFSNFKVIPWPKNVVESKDLQTDLWSKSCEIVGLLKK